MSALTLPACLITQPVQFEPPAGSPSSITSPMMGATSNPLDQIVRLTTADTMVDPFVVEVRDPDVEEVLEYRVFIDRQAGRTSDVNGVIPVIDRAAGVSRTARRLEFNLTEVRSRLLSDPAGGCYRVELFVSGRFQQELPLPAREGDLATAVWWVAVQPSVGDPTVDMNGCP